MTASCPGDDTLIALVEHVLEPSRVAALADHVDGCERCRATIGHLVAVDAKPKPSRVGRYVLEEQLGAGGMGVVWAAWDPQLERRLAIKLLRPEIGEQGAARLLREARALAQLQHPNVVAVHDVGEHEGEIFLATELVDGEALDRWQRGRTPAEILDAYLQAARGLAAAHAIGLVHRDIKPSNLLVARDGRVRVADFGLARRGAGETPPTRPLGVDHALTHTGLVVGTPAYMAPEQRAGEAVDARADQYALCVALAEALGGKRPAADATPRALGALEPHVARALARGLHSDPLARFPDVGALVEALQRPARRRFAIPLAGVGIVGGALALGFALSAPGDPTPPAVASGSAPVAALQADAAVDAPVVAVVVPDAPPAPPAPGGPAIAKQLRPANPRPAPVTLTPPSPAAGIQAYLDAAGFVNMRDRACKPAFARFDALGVARPTSMPAKDDQLLRARCELLAGNCAAGEKMIEAVHTAAGLSAPAITEEVQRESRINCPSRVGTWQDRLTRLETQAPLLQMAPAAALVRELAAAEAIVRDARGAMTSAQRIQLSNAVNYLAQGLSRLAGHCADARRARALADYDSPVMIDSLKQCLAGTTP